MSLSVSRQGHTAVVTIANPGKRNAISAEMWRTFPTLFADFEADPEVKVVVLTGADGDFSAGSDITGLANPADSSVSAEGETAIADFSKPVLSAIEGYCLGGGCQVALATDLRLAAEDAKFGIPPANLGLVYPLPGTRNLQQTIGDAWTKRLIFTGQRIDAATALRIGLVDELHPAGSVLDAALALAERIATRSQLSIRGAKAILRALATGADAEAVAATWAAEAGKGVDLREGQAAFAEKREPHFTWTGPTD